jgi:hypothetical protein
VDVVTLLTASELESIRELGESGMTTEFVITRSELVVVDTSSPSYDPSTDYGDDQMGAYTPVDGVDQPIGVTTGWLLSKLVRDFSTGEAQLTTITMQVIRMPVGTDVLPQDVLVQTDTGAEYVVIDTNVDDTWAEWLEANVRRRE